MTASAGSPAATPYEFKPGAWSSHTILLETFPPRGAGMRVLDLGCGSGYLAEPLAARGYSVTSVDKPGAWTAPFPAGVNFLAADLDQGLPPLEGPFDYVLCADILEHLRDPAGLLSQLPGLLRPRGRLIASLPNSGNVYFRWNVLLGRFPAHDRGLFDRTHLHFYTWNGWVDLFARSGLSIGSVRPTGIPVGLAIPRWETSLPVRLLEQVCYGLARIWKTMFAYQFVVFACPSKGS